MSGILIDVDVDSKKSEKDLININKNLIQLSKSTELLNSSFTKAFKNNFNFNKSTSEIKSQTNALKAMGTVGFNSFNQIGSGAAKSASAVASLGTAIKSAVVGLTAFASAKISFNISDEFTNLNNKLALVARENENLYATQLKLSKLGANTRATLKNTSESYFALARSLDKVNFSQDRILGLTKTVNQSIALSGGSVESTTAGLIQFSQGLAAGALRGEELNSVMEQIPALAKNIAKGMGVTIGELRGLAQEGKVTTDVIAKALEKTSKAIDAEFNKTAITIRQSGVLLKDAFNQLFYEIGRSISGAQNGSNLAIYISSLSKSIATFATDAGKNLEVAKQVFSNYINLVNRYSKTSFIFNAALSSAGGIANLSGYGKQYSAIKKIIDLIDRFKDKDNVVGIKETATENAAKFLETFKNLGQVILAVGRVLGSVFDNIVYKLGLATLALTSFKQDLIIVSKATLFKIDSNIGAFTRPLQRAIEGFTDAITLNRVFRTEFERSIAALANSKDLVSLRKNLDNVSEALDNRNFKGFSGIGLEIEKIATKGLFKGESFLTKLGLVEPKLLRISNINYAGIISSFKTLAATIKILFTDVIATRFSEPIARIYTFVATLATAYKTAIIAAFVNGDATETGVEIAKWVKDQVEQIKEAIVYNFKGAGEATALSVLGFFGKGLAAMSAGITTLLKVVLGFIREINIDDLLVNLFDGIANFFSSNQANKLGDSIAAGISKSINDRLSLGKILLQTLASINLSGLIFSMTAAFVSVFTFVFKTLTATIATLAKDLSLTEIIVNAFSKFDNLVSLINFNSAGKVIGEAFRDLFLIVKSATDEITSTLFTIDLNIVFNTFVNSINKLWTKLISFIQGLLQGALDINVFEILFSGNFSLTGFVTSKIAKVFNEVSNMLASAAKALSSDAADTLSKSIAKAIAGIEILETDLELLFVKLFKKLDFSKFAVSLINLISSVFNFVAKTLSRIIENSFEAYPVSKLFDLLFSGIFAVLNKFDGVAIGKSIGRLFSSLFDSVKSTAPDLDLFTFDVQAIFNKSKEAIKLAIDKIKGFLKGVVIGTLKLNFFEEFLYLNFNDLEAIKAKLSSIITPVKSLTNSFKTLVDSLKDTIEGFKEFGNLIVEKLKAISFKSIGIFLGRNLREALLFAVSSISAISDEIAPNKIFNTVVSILNGISERIQSFAKGFAIGALDLNFFDKFLLINFNNLNGVKRKIVDIINEVRKFFDSVTNVFSSKGAKELSKNIAKELGNSIKGKISFIQDVVDLFEKINFSKLGVSVVKAFSSMLKFVNNTLQQTIKQVFGNLDLTDVSVKFLKELQKLVKSINTYDIGKALGQLFYTIKTQLSELFSDNTFSFNSDAVIRQFDKLYQIVLKKLKDFAKGFIVGSKNLNIFQEFFVINYEFFKPVIDFTRKVIATLKSLFITRDKFNLFEGIFSINDKIVDTIKNVFNQVTGSVTILDSVKEYIKAFAEKINYYFWLIYDKVVGRSYWPDLIDGIISETDRLDSVVDYFVSFKNKLTSMFKDLSINNFTIDLSFLKDTNIDLEKFAIKAGAVITSLWLSLVNNSANFTAILAVNLVSSIISALDSVKPQAVAATVKFLGDVAAEIASSLIKSLYSLIGTVTTFSSAFIAEFLSQFGTIGKLIGGVFEALPESLKTIVGLSIASLFGVFGKDIKKLANKHILKPLLKSIGDIFKNNKLFSNLIMGSSGVTAGLGVALISMIKGDSTLATVTNGIGAALLVNMFTGGTVLNKLMKDIAKTLKTAIFGATKETNDSEKGKGLIDSWLVQPLKDGFEAIKPTLKAMFKSIFKFLGTLFDYLPEGETKDIAKAIVKDLMKIPETIKANFNQYNKGKINLKDLFFKTGKANVDVFGDGQSSKQPKTKNTPQFDGFDFGKDDTFKKSTDKISSNADFVIASLKSKFKALTGNLSALFVDLYKRINIRVREILSFVFNGFSTFFTDLAGLLRLKTRSLLAIIAGISIVFASFNASAATGDSAVGGLIGSVGSLIGVFAGLYVGLATVAVGYSFLQELFAKKPLSAIFSKSSDTFATLDFFTSRFQKLGKVVVEFSEKAFTYIGEKLAVALGYALVKTINLGTAFVRLRAQWAAFLILYNTDKPAAIDKLGTKLDKLFEPIGKLGEAIGKFIVLAFRAIAVVFRLGFALISLKGLLVITAITTAVVALSAAFGDSESYVTNFGRSLNSLFGIKNTLSVEIQTTEALNKIRVLDGILDKTTGKPIKLDFTQALKEIDFAALSDKEGSYLAEMSKANIERIKQLNSISKENEGLTEAQLAELKTLVSNQAKILREAPKFSTPKTFEEIGSRLKIALEDSQTGFWKGVGRVTSNVVGFFNSDARNVTAAIAKDTLLASEEIIPVDNINAQISVLEAKMKKDLSNVDIIPETGFFVTTRKFATLWGKTLDDLYNVAATATREKVFPDALNKTLSAKLTPALEFLEAAEPVLGKDDKVFKGVKDNYFELIRLIEKHNKLTDSDSATGLRSKDVIEQRTVALLNQVEAVRQLALEQTRRANSVRNVVNKEKADGNYSPSAPIDENAFGTSIARNSLLASQGLAKYQEQLPGVAKGLIGITKAGLDFGTKMLTEANSFDEYTKNISLSLENISTLSTQNILIAFNKDSEKTLKQLQKIRIDSAEGFVYRLRMVGNKEIVKNLAEIAKSFLFIGSASSKVLSAFEGLTQTNLNNLLKIDPVAFSKLARLTKDLDNTRAILADTAVLDPRRNDRARAVSNAEEAVRQYRLELVPRFAELSEGDLQTRIDKLNISTEVKVTDFNFDNQAALSKSIEYVENLNKQLAETRAGNKNGIYNDKVKSQIIDIEIAMEALAKTINLIPKIKDSSKETAKTWIETFNESFSKIGLNFDANAFAKLTDQGKIAIVTLQKEAGTLWAKIQSKKYKSEDKFKFLKDLNEIQVKVEDVSKDWKELFNDKFTRVGLSVDVNDYAAMGNDARLAVLELQERADEINKLMNQIGLTSTQKVDFQANLNGLNKQAEQLKPKLEEIDNSLEALTNNYANILEGFAFSNLAPISPEALADMNKILAIEKQIRELKAKPVPSEADAKLLADANDSLKVEREIFALKNGTFGKASDSASAAGVDILKAPIDQLRTIGQNQLSLDFAKADLDGLNFAEVSPEVIEQLRLRWSSLNDTLKASIEAALPQDLYSSTTRKLKDTGISFTDSLKKATDIQILEIQGLNGKLADALKITNNVDVESSARQSAQKLVEEYQREIQLKIDEIQTPAAEQAGRSFAENVKNNFTSGLQAVLSSEKKFKDVIYDFALNFAKNVTDTVAAGFAKGLFGEGKGSIMGWLEGLGRDLFGGAANVGADGSTALKALYVRMVGKDPVTGAVFGDGNDPVTDSNKGILGGLKTIWDKIWGNTGEDSSGSPYEMLPDHVPSEISEPIVDTLNQNLIEQTASDRSVFGEIGNIFTKGLESLGGLFQGLFSGGGAGGIVDSIKNFDIGAIFSGVIGFLGFAKGGSVNGRVSGLGHGTSDSIPARLSNGEYVVNARAAKMNMGLLNAINYNKPVGFATGGLVGGVSPVVVETRNKSMGLTQNSAKQEQVFNINVTGDISRQTRQEIQQMIPMITMGVNATNRESGVTRR